MPRSQRPKDSSRAPEPVPTPAPKPTGGSRRPAAAPAPTPTGSQQAQASGQANRGGTRGREAPPTPAKAPARPAAPTPTAAPQIGPEVVAEFREFRQLLTEALPLLRTLPKQANKFRTCLQETGQILVEAVQQLRAVEQQTREARERSERIREECAAAEGHLAALRQQREAEERRLVSLQHEAAEAETRLAAQRGESADVQGILHTLRREFRDTHQWLEERRRQPAPAAESASPKPKASAPEGHNRLGATVDPGVVVAQVFPDTPAARAGLVMGDVITAVNGAEVFSGGELRDLVYEAQAEDGLTLRVERAGVFTDVPVRLDVTPADAPPLPEGNDRLGLTVERGVVIAEVLPGTPASVAGLLHGDVILGANGTAVVSGPQLRDLVRDAPAGVDMALEIERGQDLFEAHVRFESAPGGATPAL